MLVTEINNIEFEIYPEINIDTIKEKLSEPLKYIKSSAIEYIEIGELKEMYIYMKKEGEPENEWNTRTIQFAELLNIFGIDACLSDQDYGYLDVIIVNEWEEYE